jgi:hypothetical protein
MGNSGKDQMRTIRGRVPHLIVSSDTESRVASDRQRRYEGDAKN